MTPTTIAIIIVAVIVVVKSYGVAVVDVVIAIIICVFIATMVTFIALWSTMSSDSITHSHNLTRRSAAADHRHQVLHSMLALAWNL